MMSEPVAGVFSAGWGHVGGDVDGVGSPQFSPVPHFLTITSLSSAMRAGKIFYALERGPTPPRKTTPGVQMPRKFKSGTLNKSWKTTIDGKRPTTRHEDCWRRPIFGTMRFISCLTLYRGCTRIAGV